MFQKKKGIKSFGMRGGEGNDESSAENSLIPFDELNMNPGNLVFLLVVLVRGGTPSSCIVGFVSLLGDGIKWFYSNKETSHQLQVPFSL